MAFKPSTWYPIAVVLSVVNLAGAGFALGQAQPEHAAIHVTLAVAFGRWRAVWPDHEGDDGGAPPIAWLPWHVGFWCSLAIDHSLGDGSLSRENVLWPGTADGVREWLGRLQRQWQGVLEQVSDDA